MSDLICTRNEWWKCDNSKYLTPVPFNIYIFLLFLKLLYNFYLCSHYENKSLPIFRYYILIINTGNSRILSFITTLTLNPAHEIFNDVRLGLLPPIS